MESEVLKEHLHFLPADLVEIIAENGTLKNIPKNTEILRKGQYVKVVPLVIKGVIKVFSSIEGKELLLYYIQPEQSCIMSFSAGLKNAPSKVYAVTEEDTTAVLIPSDKLGKWSKEIPEFNALFFDLFSKRYADLLDTIHHLLFNRLDERLLHYLEEKQAVLNREVIQLSHRQIANELGTAREVISRLMKRLEGENKVEQTADGIKLRNR